MDDTDTFIGSQTVGHFFKTILAQMAEKGVTTAEIELTITGKVVSFDITITSINPQAASSAG